MRISGTATRFLATGAVMVAALVSVGSAGALSSSDFTLQLVRSSASDSDATVVLHGAISGDALTLGLRPRVVLVATVQQRCVSADGTPTVERATLDSMSAPHFFTTTLRLLDSRSILVPWRATVILSSPPDGDICTSDEQPAAALTVDGITGVSYLSPAAFGPPSAGTSFYSFVLVGGQQVLPPPQLTATTV